MQFRLLTFSFAYVQKDSIRLVEIHRYESMDMFAGVGSKIISGEGACPPEDCGGVLGYEEILCILKDLGSQILIDISIVRKSGDGQLPITVLREIVLSEIEYQK